ncbi:hypothetical protein CRENBAI_017962 [Crenichthys baileyi]|uniref:Uncharacterized protein n=1 Tax=Crenichthys baileyi TaxID=28760 RepID=A0AAV9QWW4_9TELE
MGGPGKSNFGTSSTLTLRRAVLIYGEGWRHGIKMGHVQDLHCRCQPPEAVAPGGWLVPFLTFVDTTVMKVPSIDESRQADGFLSKCFIKRSYCKVIPKNMSSTVSHHGPHFYQRHIFGFLEHLCLNSIWVKRNDIFTFPL